MTYRAAFACLTSLCLACSGTEDGPGTGPDPLATAAGFCGEWASAACSADVLDACASDTEACVDAQSDFCLELIPEGYVKDQAQACIDAVRDAYEDADLTAEELAIVRKLEGPCGQLVRGPQDEGDDCIESNQCNTVDGYQCIIRPGEVNGTCQVPVEVGAGRSCDDDNAECEEGFYCNGANCIERLSENASCMADGECQAELRCNIESSGAAGAPATEEGVCTPRTPINGDCEADDDCDTNLCAKGSNDAMGICVDNLRLSAPGPVCQDLR